MPRMRRLFTFLAVLPLAGLAVSACTGVSITSTSPAKEVCREFAAVMNIETTDREVMLGPLADARDLGLNSDDPAAQGIGAAIGQFIDASYAGDRPAFDAATNSIFSQCEAAGVTMTIEE